MPNIWEAKDSNHWAYGFLVCGEAQSLGFDLHASLPRSGALPHLSVYEVDKKTEYKKETQYPFYIANGTMGLDGDAHFNLIFIYKLDNDVIENFIKAVYDRHRLLNTPSGSVSPKSETERPPSLDAFPTLAASNLPTPPLMSSRPVANTPAQNAARKKGQAKWKPFDLGK